MRNTHYLLIVLCTYFYTTDGSLEDDQPLILTPLIKSGKIKEAQEASEVKFSGFKHVKSYAAYFTVNEQHNSNMFFWFFPSQTDYGKDPVILWLQGGPGSSSLYGLFEENGPFQVKPKHGLKLRSKSWTNGHSVIYIDNPVGSGFSFTNDGGYVENETAVGEQLYEALVQFFQLFPELQNHDFFITGESYAGKYIPSVSHTILKQNSGAKVKINLQGLTIGNGLCDPKNQLQYGEYLYQIGLIDINTKSLLEKITQDAITYIDKKQWDQATDVFQNLFRDLPDRPSLFFNITGFSDHYNYLQANNTSNLYMQKYLQRPDVKLALHVGNTTFSDGENVAKHLHADMLQSVAPLISELLNNYRVLIYNGQLDIVVAYPLTLNFLQKLNFKGADEYKTASRYQWYVGEELAGYVKVAGKLTEVLVRNAGHMVPRDQPIWALDMVSRFTRNKPFH